MPRSLARGLCSLCAPVLALVLTPAAASAQSEGIVSVGGSVTFVSPTDDHTGSTVLVGPLVRLNPRPGWGFAGALNWFTADLADPSGAGAEFARLRVRPLLGGIGYTMRTGTRTMVNVSVVAGPSFNSVDFEEAFLAAQPGTPAIDAETSFVVRPGISVTQTVAPRVGITGFAGYMFNRPDIVYRTASGTMVENEWSADSLVLSIGVVYSLF